MLLLFLNNFSSFFLIILYFLQSDFNIMDVTFHEEDKFRNFLSTFDFSIGYCIRFLEQVSIDLLGTNFAMDEIVQLLKLLL